jgi:SAM-dependent methyltransferase
MATASREKAQRLYELWADGAELRGALEPSLEPRGTDSLYDAFAALGPEPGQLLVDVGARDARHTIRLVREHGLRALALDPVPVHVDRARAAVSEAGLDGEIEVMEGAIESLPFPDASVDWLWCRDVHVHVDARRGLAECARVLRPDGAMVAYVTLATDRLEPRERADLVRASAIATFDADVVEAAAAAGGLALRSVDRIGTEWRERMVEERHWDPGEDLLRLARLARRRDELAARHGEDAVAAAWSGLVWGVYQLLGKLSPTIYVWARDA